MSKLNQWKGELLLGGSFFTGCIFILLHRWLSIEGDEGFLEQVGHALIIAPIVARGIELWMTRRIAQDVFRAAFGYSMPDHFKEEIKRIADQRLICTRHRMYVNVEIISDDTVRTTTRIYREIKNIGPGDEPLAGLIHIDEWGFSEKSEIIQCKISYDGKEYEVSRGKIRREGDSTVKAETATIKIKANTVAACTSEGVEIRRINDHLMYSFKAPTENPLIHLTLPTPLDGRAEAGIPGGIGGESAAIPGQYEFIGVYFPPSHMRIRWWPKN